MRATERLARIAHKTGARVHLLHVSTVEEMEFVRGHKDRVSVEVTPQHLSFTADDYALLGTRLQMNPPVRAGRGAAPPTAGPATAPTAAGWRA